LIPDGFLLDSSIWTKDPGINSGYIVKSSVPIYPYVYSLDSNCLRKVNGTVPHRMTIRPMLAVDDGSKPGSSLTGIRIDVWSTSSALWVFGGAITNESTESRLMSSPKSDRSSWMLVRYITAKEYKRKMLGTVPLVSISEILLIGNARSGLL
jgi:hypothetical protein